MKVKILQTALLLSMAVWALRSKVHILSGM